MSRIPAGCAHAYLAGLDLLRWLAATEPMDANVPVWRIISASIDGAFANLPGMYAPVPDGCDTAVHGRACTDIHPRFTPEGKPRKLMDKAISRVHSEIVVAILSPVHWLTMRRRSRVT